MVAAAQRLKVIIEGEVIIDQEDGTSHFRHAVAPKAGHDAV